MRIPERGFRRGKRLNCNVFRQSIYHFQADELPESERQALQEHLDACTDCATRLEVEESFLRGIKARVVRAPAPPGLETRIRAALEQRRVSVRGSSAWFRAPWFAAAAASLLLALLLLPWTDSPFDREQSTPVLQVEQEVTVVDHDCDRAGLSYPQQRGCRNERHLNALKLQDGSYWNIGVDEEASRDLLLDPHMRGHRILVRGDLYPAIRTLELRGSRDLGLISRNQTRI